MKTISKTIYEKHYTSPSRWGQKIESYIKIEIRFNLRDGIWFLTSVPNFSSGNKNLIKSITRVLEHESIGMAKYNGLKEICYSKKLWKSI